MNVVATSQRLIFLGKVLPDDKTLAESDLASKTVHLVQKSPHSRNDGPPTGAQAAGGHHHHHHHQNQFRMRHPAGGTPDNSYLLGEKTLTM